MNALFGRLNLLDILKGAIVAGLAIILTGVGNILQTGVFPNWDSLVPILLTGLSAFLAYILKNIFTNSAGQILTSEKNVIVNETVEAANGNKITTIETKS